MITAVPIAFYETLCVNRSAINCLSTSPSFPNTITLYVEPLAAVKTKNNRVLIQPASTSYSERGLPRKFPSKSKTFPAASKVANAFMPWLQKVLSVVG
jgi:hypothetical protein